MIRRLVLLLVTLATAGFASLAVTSAASAADNTQGTMYSNGTPGSLENVTCGGPTVTDPSLVVGFVNYHLSGTTLMLNIHIMGGSPNTTYGVILFEGNNCSPAYYGASLTTNGNGVGNATESFTVDNPPVGGVYQAFLQGYNASGLYVAANSVAVSP